LNNPKQELDNIARLQQMKINTRLVSLETAQKLMATMGYLGVAGQKADTGNACWVKEPGAVDHITLLAIATDIENYILGNLEQETKDALEAAAQRANAPRIVRP